MYFYIALGVVILLFIWRVTAGFKRGMIQEIISLIAMAAAGFCVLLILGAIESYLDKEIAKLVQFIVILLAVCLVYRLINILFTSLRLISKLPIIKALDKVLGAVVGLAEAGILAGILVDCIKNWGISQILK